MFENLLKTLQVHSAITLGQWQEQLIKQLGEQVLKNSDYYSFLVHLTQKKEYSVQKIIEKPDTFLEEAVKVFLEEQEIYQDMTFHLQMLPDEEIFCGEKMSVTNVLIERGN